MLSDVTLGELVALFRRGKQLSQEALAKEVGTNRSRIAHLEQGIREVTDVELEKIGEVLSIPSAVLTFGLKDYDSERARFELLLSDLVGRRVSLRHLSEEHVPAANELRLKLFGGGHSDWQARDILNSLLVFYNVPITTPAFFKRYLSGRLSTLSAFSEAVVKFQIDAIRMFSTFSLAFESLNVDEEKLLDTIAPLEEIDLSSYRERAPWQTIQTISEDRLPDLGYIAAALVQKEGAQRQSLKSFLEELADKVDLEGPVALDGYTEKKRRTMDALLRQFNSSFPHGLLSPLFLPDPEKLRREAALIAPLSDSRVAEIAETQKTASHNLAQYLAADHLDVYVATSMRDKADFVSVNKFVSELFRIPEISILNLRHFNPTQSWIEDRIAKGLVEAIMLRRAKVCIYMAQRSDTFGKDSEASVALGLGRPVIVYVPRLKMTDIDLDTESAFNSSPDDLLKLLKNQADVDELEDKEALFGRYVKSRLNSANPQQLSRLIRDVWSDFDLYGEDFRIKDEKLRASYRKYLDRLLTDEKVLPSRELASEIVGIFVALATHYEKRAKLFRETHPLALQVILSSGVLNGILVVRSVEQCALVLKKVLENSLALSLESDEFNYRLIENTTKSTLRVISKNILLRNAFEAFCT